MGLFDHWKDDENFDQSYREITGINAEGDSREEILNKIEKRLHSDKWLSNQERLKLYELKERIENQ